MVRKDTGYMDLNEMIAILSRVNYDDSKRLFLLFNSMNRGEFYTAYGSIMEKTKDVNVRKLVNNIFDYHTVDKKGEKENVFISNLNMLFNALYNNVAKDIQNLLLSILSLTDEKSKYNLLKWFIRSIKDEDVKDSTYLALLNNKNAVLSDFNLYLIRWVDRKISLQKEKFDKIISGWMVQIKRFVLIADYPEEEFDAVFQSINKTLVKIAERNASVVGNIRYIYDIQPSNRYKQAYYKKLYSDIDGIKSPATARFVELNEKLGQQHNLILNLQSMNERLNEKILETKSVREKKLEKKVNDLIREIKQLKQEKEDLIEENKKLRFAADMAKVRINRILDKTKPEKSK